MELNLSIIENTTLKIPLELFIGQTIELSGFDRISPAMLYTIFFYKQNNFINTESTSSEENPMVRVKRALQEVLVSWYPATGRFIINDVTGKLEIECNNSGVIMVSAVTDSRLEELGKLHEYKPCYEKLVPQLPQSNDISENPLVVVQITRFACGGFSVGFGGSHALFDGFGAFSFLASWAQLSRGSTNEADLLVPNHSRDALLHLINSSPSSSPSLSIYEQDHVAAIQDLYGIPMQAMASNDRGWGSALAKFGEIDSLYGLELVTLCLKKETVEMLKRIAIERGNLSKCSTFDVLCAHLWKARVKTLSLDPSTNICLQFPVDGRKRLQPPLGDNFTGNAFVLASVSCLVRELQQEPLHNTIQKIQAAKDVITGEYIKLYAKALESSDKFFPSMRELTIVTDWLKFPFDKFDFGWGKVSSAALLATPVPETAFLMPDFEDSGFLVRIGIGRELVRDFISYFNHLSYY